METHAVLWPQAGAMPQDLGTLNNGSMSHAAAVNASGQIVGTSDNDRHETHAVLWPQAGAMPQDLGTLPNGHNSYPKAMNDAGQIVGTGDTNGLSHGFSWTAASGRMTEIPPIGPACNAIGTCSEVEVLAVSNSGQVVGASTTRISGVSHAFLWTEASGSPMDLGTIFPQLDNMAGSTAYAVNDSGQVVGSSGAGSVNVGPVSRAFLWTQADHMKDLGILPGFTDSFARAVNASSLIVGSASNANAETHAVWWAQGASMPQDLGTAGFPGSTATAVNASGVVIGNSLNQPTHAVVWDLQCWLR
jgi:probable HAF family extracellular repeat protein